MKIDKAAQPGPCDAIEAEFVFGPVRCLRWTPFTTVDDGETFYVCEKHIAADAAEASDV